MNMTSSNPTIGSKSPEQWITVASEFEPQLKERAGLTEVLRQIPSETVKELAEVGLFRLFNPPRFGGSHELTLSFDLSMELGRACGSTAWCFSVWMSHNWLVGHWPEQAQQEYFADSFDTLSSSGFAPSGKLEPTGGGFRLSGRWGFSSGCDASSWAFLGAIGPLGPMLALVPRSDYEIIDTWYVSGLRGTGSKDIETRDAFVPAHRVVLMSDLSRGISPGWELHGSPSYRLPMLLGLSGTIAAPLIGIAQGAIDEVVKRAKTDSRSAQSGPMQIRLAESAAEVNSARILLRHCTREMRERASNGETLSLLDQATYVRNNAYAAKLAVQAVERLFQGSGGYALYDQQPLQRHFRDVHAGSHHVGTIWDLHAESYGRIILGLETGPSPLSHSANEPQQPVSHWQH